MVGMKHLSLVASTSYGRVNAISRHFTVAVLCGKTLPVEIGEPRVDHIAHDTRSCTCSAPVAGIVHTPYNYTRVLQAPNTNTSTIVRKVPWEKCYTSYWNNACRPFFLWDFTLIHPCSMRGTHWRSKNLHKYEVSPKSILARTSRPQLSKLESN